jgi:predicted transcriptional regulator
MSTIYRARHRDMAATKKTNEVDQEVQRVRNAVVSGEITASELARQSGVPKTTLVGIKEKTWNPRAATLSKLIDGLAKSRRKPSQQQAAEKTQ